MNSAIIHIANVRMCWGSKEGARAYVEAIVEDVEAMPEAPSSGPLATAILHWIPRAAIDGGYVTVFDEREVPRSQTYRRRRRS